MRLWLPLVLVAGTGIGLTLFSNQAPDPGKKGLYRLNASHAGFAASSEEVKRGEQEVAIVMQPGWTISGQVLWDESLSEQGMYVAVHSTGKGWGEFEYGEPVHPGVVPETAFHLK